LSSLFFSARNFHFPGELEQVIFCVQGVVSPLLANLVLDELDQMLERRGRRFVRYADDCNIYVRSRRAGERVMASVSQSADPIYGFISVKLKLKVNSAKSAVARPWDRKFLGFSLSRDRQPKRRIAPKAAERFKQRIRELTSRTRGIGIRRMANELSQYLRGWLGYFGQCQTPSVLEDFDKWIRRRLRSMIWKQWKRYWTRYRQLRKRGVERRLAINTAKSNHGPWRLAKSPALAIALSNAYFDSLGIPRLTVSKA